MSHICKICSASFGSEHTAMPYSKESKNIFIEAHHRFDDLADKQYGEDGFTPVCKNCFLELAKKHPWLLEAVK